MSNLDLISFERTDYVPSHIEEVAMKVAEHFKIPRDYLPEYCQLIRTSKRWTIKNLEKKLLNWKNMFSRVSGRNKIIEVTETSFIKCRTNEDIHKLRGVLVEALIIGCNGGADILKQKNFGWGAKVNINLSHGNIEVKYICNHPTNVDCFRRSTVDFGSWDGYHGKFYECKVQPDNIQCKEVQYMKKLKEELSNNNISHEIFFLCADSRDEVIIKLKSMGLNTVEFKPLGFEDLSAMVSA